MGGGAVIGKKGPSQRPHTCLPNQLGHALMLNERVPDLAALVRGLGRALQFLSGINPTVRPAVARV